MPRAVRGRPPHPDLLTPAEWRVLFGVQHGLSNPALARRLGVSVDAIKYHLGNILAKTGQPDRQALRRMTLVPAGTVLTAAGLERNEMAARQAFTSEETAAMTDTGLGPLGQVARTVADIEQARSWYERVLELPHLFTFGTLSFFDLGGTRLMLSQAEALNPKESILYFRVDDILDTSEQLQARGVEFIAAPHRIHTHADGTEEWMAFFKDPEGRPLALMAQVRGRE